MVELRSTPVPVRTCVIEILYFHLVKGKLDQVSKLEPCGLWAIHRVIADIGNISLLNADTYFEVCNMCAKDILISDIKCGIYCHKMKDVNGKVL